MDEEREPDLTDTPGGPEGGSSEGTPGGYGADTDEPDTSGAPSESSPDEGDAGQATGNPGAAG